MRTSLFVCALLLVASPLVPSAAADEDMGSVCPAPASAVVCYHHTYVPDAGAECRGVYVLGQDAQSSRYFIVQCEGGAGCPRYHDSNVPGMPRKTCHYNGPVMLTDLPWARLAPEDAFVCTAGSSPGLDAPEGVCLHHTVDERKGAACEGVYWNGMAGAPGLVIVCAGELTCTPYYDVVLHGERVVGGCQVPVPG